MKQQSFLEWLQNLHPSHKNKILAVAAIVSVFGLGSIWVSSVKNQLKGLDTRATALNLNSGTVLSASKHITLEFQEEKGDKRYVYFKVENSTDDILNFSSIEQVKITANDKGSNPELITDRQQAKFPAKILSHTTVYGTLILSDLSIEEGTLVFDDLYFETSPDIIFKESIEFDFSELKTVEELRY